MQQLADEEAGKPKVHKVALEASQCVRRMLNESASLYGGLMNLCAFKINVVFCTVGAKDKTSAAGFACATSKPGLGGGLSSVPANDRNTLHTKDAPVVVWAACQDPAYPTDLQWTTGQSGIAHRCR